MTQPRGVEAGDVPQPLSELDDSEVRLWRGHSYPDTESIEKASKNRSGDLGLGTELGPLPHGVVGSVVFVEKRERGEDWTPLGTLASARFAPTIGRYEAVEPEQLAQPFIIGRDDFNELF